MSLHPDDRLDRARELHEELLAEEEHRWVREDRLTRHSDQPYPTVQRGAGLGLLRPLAAAPVGTHHADREPPLVRRGGGSQPSNNFVPTLSFLPASREETGVPLAGSERRSSRSASPAALREPSPSSTQPAAPSAAPGRTGGPRGHSNRPAVAAQRIRPALTDAVGPDASAGGGVVALSVRSHA